jgi:hypothetical protein
MGRASSAVLSYFFYESFMGITTKGEIHVVSIDEEEVRATCGRAFEMAAAELTTKETEQERIERWRAEELERAGYERAAAVLLAGRFDVDLHYATDLLRAGCEPELALQILL